MSQEPTNGVIYWFRNDLRLHDNPGLQKAIALSQQRNTWLLPVYVHDTSLRLITTWGFVRTSDHRFAWKLMAVQDVAQQLLELGSQLLQLTGEPGEVLTELSKVLTVRTVICEEIAAPFELAQVQTLRNQGVEVLTVWQSTLMSPDQLPFAPQDVPDVFTHFRRAVEHEKYAATLPVATVKQLPSLPNHKDLESQLEKIKPADISYQTHKILNDPRSSFPWSEPEFHGGERSALTHLAQYCNRELPHTYKTTRNGLIGINYSTKWSPWLATGALSARQAWQAIRQFENRFGANESTYWIYFELLWRDYFRWLHLKHGIRMYQPSGLKDSPRLVSTHDKHAFELWRTGKTGHALIDAGIQELNTTGYISNRMRQILASYLIHDLRCDWRCGAAWFESQLIDFDVYNNQGNWLYQSGQGTDPRGPRRFNPDKQAQDYDPDGVYRKLWLQPLPT